MSHASSAGFPRAQGTETQSGTVGAQVFSILTATGINRDKAATLAQFCQEVGSYVEKHPHLKELVKDYKDTKEVREGTKKVVQSQTLLRNANAINLVSASEGFKSVRASGAASVLKVFVDRFEGYAKANKIELNDCSLAVSKVSLDIATAGAASATAVGLALAGVAMLATYKDSYALGKACFTK